MRILFLTIGDMPSINHHEIYPDLLRSFIDLGHEVYVVCSREKRLGLPTELIDEKTAKILKVHIGNITKTNMLEKGLSTLLIGYQYKHAIKKYYANVEFDLVIYSTPPITLTGVVEYVKRKYNSHTYLLLKDIFPQNAVDIGVLKKVGIKGIIYRYFRMQEKRLYSISDMIGCMSQANVDYVLNHNNEIDSNRIEVCPNSIEVFDKSVGLSERIEIRKKYDIPLDVKVFVYGGNLGKPQGIPFLIKCLKKCSDIEDAYFLIVGDGTEYSVLEEYVNDNKSSNVKLMKKLPKEDYDTLVGACDVGMIFLDHRFTIPNFPSRLLSYMQAKLPVLAVTDPNTDIGKVITEGQFGWWCESNNEDVFALQIHKILNENFPDKNVEFDYLMNNYSSDIAVRTILNNFNY